MEKYVSALHWNYGNITRSKSDRFEHVESPIIIQVLNFRLLKPCKYHD